MRSHEFKELVRVKTDLFGQDFDEIFHAKCWGKLKIYKEKNEATK